MDRVFVAAPRPAVRSGASSLPFHGAIDVTFSRRRPFSRVQPVPAVHAPVPSAASRRCWPCRRATKTRPRLVETSIDELERKEEAEDATYYFLESFHGHPEDD
jgi:hypothetical protein